MSRFNISRRAGLGLGAAALLAAGAAGGATAVSATRPAVQMAPLVRTPIARLPAATGIVTVKGRVAELFGDRVVLQDGSGRTMIDVGPDLRGTIAVGATLMAQGRYDNGQLRTQYLVDADGRVSQVGRGPHGPGPDGPGRGGPGGPRDKAAPPPPPPCAGPATGPARTPAAITDGDTAAAPR